MRHATSQSSPMRHATSQSSPMRHTTSQSSPMRHTTSQSSPMRHATSQSSPMRHATGRAIQNSLCHDPKLQYPPLNAAKCGRPKKVGRIKSASEQKRSKVRCTACGNAGHNRRSVKCSKHKKFGRG